MAKAIIERWPYLKKEHMNANDAQFYWKKRLRTYFKNTRGKTRDHPEMMQKQAIFGKKRGAENHGEAPLLKKTNKAWGVVNYLPEREIGEDDATQAAFVKKLQDQATLLSHRQDSQTIIDLAMRKTFPDRRKKIITEMALLDDVLTYYPQLANESQVIK